MGKENSIRTSTNISSKLIGSGTGFSSYNLNQKLSKSIYSYAIVTFVNPIGKLISYNIIEDNLGLNKTGTAIPLYPNKIIVPTIGSVVPLLRGPDTSISTNAGQYSKTTYYLDPIGVQQTVKGNTIIKEVPNTPAELNVNNINIQNSIIGIPNNFKSVLNSLNSSLIYGYKALIPDTSFIKDSELEIVKGPFITNTGTVQELAVIDGKPVGKDIAKAIILMKRVALKDGITLHVNSGFRSPTDIIDKISTKGTPVTADSQTMLYKAYIADPEHKPYTKPPGESNHGNAFAFDLNTGSVTGKIKESLKKDIYQWLMNNAYKFGFVRWEPEEEWHWEYRPGEYQYNVKVPKNNFLYKGMNT